MGKRLTSIKPEKGTKLSRLNEPFKISIASKLDNGYEIKDMDPNTVKAFHRFVDETVAKSITISQVDTKYLRGKDSNLDEAAGKDIIHYGHDGSTFRLFGYYNDDSYFVITRIDGKHKTHKA